MRTPVSQLLAAAVFCLLAIAPDSTAVAGLMSTASLLDAGPAAGLQLGLTLDAGAAADTDEEADAPAENPQVVLNSALLSPGGTTGSMSGSSVAGAGAAGGLAAALPLGGGGQPGSLSTRLRLASVLKPLPPALGGVFHPPREK